MITRVIFNTEVHGNSFHGDGSQLTNITADPYSGNANHVVLTNNDGHLTDAAHLDPVYGGLGIDASALSGIVKADGNGNFTAAQISNTDVASNANLDRSKIAAGTANYILVNDGVGAMSEVQYLDREKIAVDNANQYKFLYNDNTGAIAPNDALQINANDLVCNPSSDILLEKDIYADANKKYLLQKVLNVQTTNDTPTAIYSLTCENNKSYLVKFELLLVDSSTNSGIINGYCKVKHANSSTQPTASYIISNGSILDNALANCEVQLDVSVNDTFKLMVVGIPATTIDWQCKVDFIKN